MVLAAGWRRNAGGAVFRRKEIQNTYALNGAVGFFNSPIQHMPQKQTNRRAKKKKQTAKKKAVGSAKERDC